MSDFPTLVYRTPGPHGAGGAKTFDYRAADDAEVVATLLSEGWHETLTAALEPPEAPDDHPDATEKSEAREKLEADARALGIRFSWKTADEKLSEKIDAALAEEKVPE